MPNNLNAWIQTYPNFPKSGILFYDISPIIEQPDRLRAVCEMIRDSIAEWKPDLLAGIDSRGFLFATPVSLMMDLGVVMLRKKGKLPGDVLEESFALEYGEATLAIQKDRNLTGKRVALIDDLLATGGTLNAAEMLLKNSGARVVGTVVLIELTLLNGRRKLKSPVKSLQTYDE